MRRAEGPSAITRRLAAAWLAAGAAWAPDALSAHAQTPADTPTTPPNTVKAEETTLRMTVPVMIDGKGPFQFIVDTASNRTTISSELAAALALPRAGQLVVDTATGRSPTISVKVARMQVGPRDVSDLKLPVFLRENIGADGLLGIDALGEQNIVMDLRAKRMTIEPSTRNNGPDEIVVTAWSQYGQLVLVDASIDKESLFVVIDTGGEGSIANNRLRQMIFRQRLKNAAQGQVIGVSGVIANADFDILPRVKLGGVVITNLQVAYADVHAFDRFGLKNKPAMLLGMDLLRHFDRVSVDFKAKRVRFLLPRDAPYIPSSD